MTQSLKKQLKSVADRNKALGGHVHNQSTKRKASLLFTEQEAADIDLDTIYEIGLKGLTGLSDVEPLFLRFHPLLFDNRPIEELDRSMKTKAENEQIDHHLRDFMRLCQPFYLERSCQQALEWLIRAYRVNELNIRECLDCILPYHDTPEFVRFVQILYFREDDPYGFLFAPVKQGGQPVHREFLAKRCVVDRRILEWSMEAFEYLIASEHSLSKPISPSFVALLCAEYLQRLPTVDQIIASFVLPFTLKCMRSSTVDIQLGGMLIIGCLFERTSVLDGDLAEIVHALVCMEEGIKAEAVMLLTRMCALFPGKVVIGDKYRTELAECVHRIDSEFDYARAGNPTRKEFEAAIAHCEGGKYGFSYSSGLAAMSTLLCMLKTGDKVLSIDDVYGGADRLLTKVAVPQWGLLFLQIGMTDLKELEHSMDASVKMIWIESPTNPTLRVVDIGAIVSTAKRANPDVMVVIDNTFATPYLQLPLQLGADIVIHSVTKYIGGHSDVLMGAIVTSDEKIADRLRFLQKAMGSVPSPFDCFMALRGLKTLAVRMKQHCEGALQVAQFLSKHERVSDVFYPGLPTSRHHEIAKKQMRRGFGGIVSFRLKDATLENTVKLTQSLKLVTLAESLGGVESLIDVPSVMTHASLSAESRARLGITDTLLRVSVGIEDPADIISDLDYAIRAAFSNCNV